ncbi:MAG: OmpA family protein [Oligoflexia bacterium]|nr:OmpA family protein [Oligoflexia bacterium]
MLLFLIATGTVLAQSAAAVSTPDLNAQLMRPTVDGQRTLWVDDATFYRVLRPTARLLVQYLNDPLVYRTATGDRLAVVSDVVQADALLGLGTGRLSLGVDVPVYAYTAGTGGRETGLGDLAADFELGILDPQKGPLGLALQGRLMLPTATVQTSLGSPGLGYEVGAILDLRVDDTQLVLNAGTRGLPEAVLENVTLHDQVYGRLALAQSLLDGDLAGVAAELTAHANYSAPLDNPAALPVEGMLSGYLRAGSLTLRAGGGMGFTNAVGAPDFRALLAIGFEPPNVADRDHDGIVDEIDDCLNQPEDFDGYRDADGCPDPATMVHVRFVDEDGRRIDGVRMAIDQGQGFKEHDPVRSVPVHPGSYALQAAVPGFVPLRTRIDVPQAEDADITRVMVRPNGVLEVRVVDPNGRPLAARWSLDGGDRGRVGATSPSVTVKAGEHAIVATANGFRPAAITVKLKADTHKVVEVVLVPSRVVVTADRIELREKVFFDLDKASIRPESFPLLDEVVAVMRQNTEIRRVRIEGHTDERGSEDYNQQLSDQRAASVRRYLVDHGIQADRLRSVGLGETKPLDPGHDEAAWSQNRRVELWIEDRAR